MIQEDLDGKKIRVWVHDAKARGWCLLDLYPEVTDIAVGEGEVGHGKKLGELGEGQIGIGYAYLRRNDGGPWLVYLSEDGRIWWPESKAIGTWEVEQDWESVNNQESVMSTKVKPSVKREGLKIEIDGMSVKDAVAALVKMEEQDNQTVNIHCEFKDMFLTEGLIAFTDALEERYGRSFGETTHGFFGPICPTLVSITVGPGQIRQVVWGKISVPGVAGTFQTGVGWSNGSPVFVLGGQLKQKHKDEVEELFELTRKIGKEKSIYKGKALELRFPDREETSNPDDFAPKFLEFGSVDPPVFNPEIQAVIDNYIYEDIEATGLTKQNGMPIKKGILLEGPPGVGKTLLAHTLAQKCQEYGWTFCYLRDVKDMAQAVELVRGRWEPAMIFGEDIDRVVGRDRTDAVNDVLNIIDGVDAKRSDIVVLVTTNDIDIIHKAMLRPGRLDVLISVTAPEPKTVEALIRREAGSGLDYEEDLTEVGVELAGTMPAVIVQVVQRAKRAAQRRVRLSGELPYADVLNPRLKNSDLMIAAKSMKAHIERLKPVATDDRTPIEKAADTLAGALVHQSDSDKKLLEAWGETGYMTPPPNGRGVSKRTNHSVVGGKSGADTE